MITPPQRHPCRDRCAPRLTHSVYCSLDSRLRNESGTPSPWTTGSHPTHRAALRYIDMKRSRSDSKVFRLSPSRVVFTRWPEPVQAGLVVPPEAFDATGCKCVFRVLLQHPTRDQVFAAFVYIQHNRQHRCPSVHFPPPSLLDTLHSVPSEDVV